MDQPTDTTQSLSDARVVAADLIARNTSSPVYATTDVPARLGWPRERAEAAVDALVRSGHATLSRGVFLFAKPSLASFAGTGASTTTRTAENLARFDDAVFGVQRAASALYEGAMAALGRLVPDGVLERIGLELDDARERVGTSNFCATLSDRAPRVAALCAIALMDGDAPGDIPVDWRGASLTLADLSEATRASVVALSGDPAWAAAAERALAANREWGEWVEVARLSHSLGRNPEPWNADLERALEAAERDGRYVEAFHLGTRRQHHPERWDDALAAAREALDDVPPDIAAADERYRDALAGLRGVLDELSPASPRPA